MIKDNLVLTISIGDYHNKISELTAPLIEQYAKKINADFLHVKEINPKYGFPRWQKFIIHELLNKYKRIIYFDIDLIIREDTPSLFDVVPENKLGVFNEGRFIPRFSLLEQASEYYKEPLKKWKGGFYNTGVMVLSRNHKELFKLPRHVNIVEQEKPYLNLRILNDDIKVFELSYDYNRTDTIDKIIGISRLNSYIVHYSGAPENMIFEVLKKDLEQWKMDSPEYKYFRNILISTSGGMGNQLCAEPVIRFTEKIYPDANIFVVTHFPELFNHLDMPVLKYDEWKGINDAIMTMYPNPDDENSEHKLPHFLFHPTDFASTSMIKRTIPNKDKQIKLKVVVDDVATIMDLVKNKPENKKLVLVHPGKWWPSKTFPVEWWQELVNKLSEKLCVGLIGKTVNEEQGFLPVKCPSDGIDFRDLTSLGELIALISLSKCVITNDSSPLHIAGAFDNWIVTIPTCKHPDHILPYRKGNQKYKTKALYKKLLLDDLKMNEFGTYDELIDKIPKGKSILDYIPDVDEVVREVFEIYEEDFSKQETINKKTTNNAKTKLKK